ncbi:MAG: hypothetical protein AABX04_08130 [Nanoarchaeota archaeon]
MALEQKIENIDGNLRDAYKQAVPGTLKHVDELMRERRDDASLRDLWFYTADGEVYSMYNGTPTLRITRKAVNPVLNNIDDAFIQLTTQENYFVTPEDFAAVKAANDTVTIDLTKLELSGKEKEWRYLAVDTSKDIGDYNPEQQKLLKRVFGPTEADYDANMAKLRTSPQRIAETKIYVLAPDYVKANAKKDAIGRASWLYYFNYYSCFNAVVRTIYYDSRVRGVRREVVAAGDASETPSVPIAPQEMTLGNCYARILGSPDAAVSALDDKTAAGLSCILTRYLAGKAQ